MQCRGWKVLNIYVWKSFPISHKAHPRPDGHDLRLSQKSCVWILTYDQWWIPSNDFWPSDVKISIRLFAQHCVWQIDNAWKSKEFGLNRETRRFMKLQMTIDKFHQNNHTSCGKNFNSSEYASLNGKNTQSCEQTNAKLRKIATYCTFMNPDMFMTAVTLYLGYQNLAKTF